jgi:hypothetical protein
MARQKSFRSALSGASIVSEYKNSKKKDRICHKKENRPPVFKHCNKGLLVKRGIKIALNS